MKAKHKENNNPGQQKILTIITFLLGASSAFVLYLESDYLRNALKSENITFFYVVANTLALITAYNWHRVIRRYGKISVFRSTLAAKTAILAALALSPVHLLGAWILTAYIVLTFLTWMDLDLLLESCSSDRITGKTRGAYLTFQQAGYLFVPMIAGTLVERGGFNRAFLISFLLSATIWLFVFLKVKNIPECAIKKKGFIEMIKAVLKRKNVLRIYYVSFALEFFYAMIIIYSPLYLLDMGFSWNEIGAMFSMMLLPFLFFPYLAGWLSDNFFEERTMLYFSLTALGGSVLWLYLADFSTFWGWTLVLVTTRIGASATETLKDSYFFKRIDYRDVDIIDLFRSVRPMAYLMGAMATAPVVFLGGIKSVFLLIALVVFSSLSVLPRLASSRLIEKG